jgi:hypothetical protein
MLALPLIALALVLAPQAHRVPVVDEVAALRAEGPPALGRLLARYDALPDGPEKDDLERTIDAVAAQRYATYSRLYWYTDLDAAEAAARASGKPILSLRMLGRLDEDLSCANSRLFRVVLYANEDVSRFLRESFVLHWSSERPVPRVTVDFGDGRRIETTVGGNSAHFVLDADGRPIDVLPGLYSPVAFRRELEAALPLARESPGFSDEERRLRLRAYHRERADAKPELPVDPDSTRCFPVPTEPHLFAAEGLATCKGMIEVPLVLRGGLDPQRTLRRLSLGIRFTPRLGEARLDANSRELVRRLRPTDWKNSPKPLDAEGLDAEIAVLEANVAADTAENQGLRGTVHNWFQSPADPPNFAELSRRLYAELFLTPADDPWLGLSTPLIFTGLPGDGVLR